jgi:lipoate-protein ligase B
LISPEELADRGVTVHHVDRGGEATYHGPGQLVCYPIVDLRARGCSVRGYVSLLEETIIASLAVFGVTGFRRRGTAGIWTGVSDKIASIGVRIQKRVTSHGLSINVAMPLDPGELIISCGMTGIRIVNLNQLVEVPVSIQAVRQAVAKSFARVFNVTLVPCSLEKIIERD